MNKEFIDKLINPHLVGKKISEQSFEKLFDFLPLQDKYIIIDYLIERGIDLIFDNETTNIQELNNDSKGNYDHLEETCEISNRTIAFDSSGLNKLNNEELCLMYQRGNQNVLGILIQKNERFIWKIVQKYSKSYQHRLDDEDLYMYGFFGFKKAVERFDIKKECKFLTYAHWWVTQSITRAIPDNGYLVRIPVHLFEKVNHIRKTIQNHSFETDKELTDFLVSEENYSIEKAKEIISISHNLLSPASLDVCVGEDHDTQLIELFVPEGITVEQEVERKLISRQLHDCVGRLKPRQAEIIRMRFGITTGERMTLEEVGKHFNVTRERIRQIESTALSKLRKMQEIKAMHGDLEERNDR
ncbi:sigma-70 family RNA polymerase sigma factor [Clostridia bacterium]|nr:sigma-70 family RNA polymerase sigma factor [Clostridia bacterium]